jgi:mRNA interferase MazF
VANPGDVVLVTFAGAAATKVRPALVISSSIYHASRPDVVLSILTTNVGAATGPTDYVLKEWAAAGLHAQTAFRSFFRTEPRSNLIRRIGSLSPADWAEVQARLRIALAVT